MFERLGANATSGADLTATTRGGCWTTVTVGMGGARRAAVWLVLVVDLLERDDDDEDEEDEEEDTRFRPPRDSSRDERLSEWKCSSFRWPSLLAGGGGTTSLAVYTGATFLTTQQTGDTTGAGSTALVSTSRAEWDDDDDKLDWPTLTVLGTFRTSALLTGRSTMSRCRTQSGPTGPAAGIWTTVVWGTGCGATATDSVSSRLDDDDEEDECLLDDEDPSSSRAALVAPETGTTT